MAEIASILRVVNDSRLPAFQIALRELGEERRRTIQTMPIGYPIAPFKGSAGEKEAREAVKGLPLEKEVRPATKGSPTEKEARTAAKA